MFISKAKLMMLAAPLALAVSLPAMAETVTKNPDGTKTVTEVVGYEETIAFTVPGKDDIFARMDTSNNGLVEWTEFRNYAQMDDEYSMFLKMDRNRDKVIELNEYREFDKLRNQVVTESDGADRVAVDRQATATQNLPNDATYTRYVPTKTQNFGSRLEY